MAGRPTARNAIKLFNQAAAADPTYAEAEALLTEASIQAPRVISTLSASRAYSRALTAA